VKIRGNRFTDEQIVSKVRKTQVILIAIFFVTSITVTLVTATQQTDNDQTDSDQTGSYQTDSNQPRVFSAVKSSFTGYPTSGSAPLNVYFQDQSSSTYSIKSWDWDFGDGDTSTLRNPTHIYTTPGKYTVSLMITNSGGGTATYNKKDYINVDGGSTGDDGITCEFRTYPIAGTSGPAPLTVHFQDRSTSDSNIIAWDWDFGDGGTSTSKNPIHTYTTPDRYTVTLRVWDANGNAGTEVKTKYILAY
jgi:PKD repeat protein